MGRGEQRPGGDGVAEAKTGRDGLCCVSADGDCFEALGPGPWGEQVGCGEGHARVQDGQPEQRKRKKGLRAVVVGDFLVCHSHTRTRHLRPGLSGAVSKNSQGGPRHWEREHA